MSYKTIYDSASCIACRQIVAVGPGGRAFEPHRMLFTNEMTARRISPTESALNRAFDTELHEDRCPGRPPVDRCRVCDVPVWRESDLDEGFCSSCESRRWN